MDRLNKDIVFMPGWSAFAESAEAALACKDLGLVWPGTEPVASTSLEKIGFKRICEKVGAPTPPFRVLADRPSLPRVLLVDETGEIVQRRQRTAGSHRAHRHQPHRTKT